MCPAPAPYSLPAKTSSLPDKTSSHLAVTSSIPALTTEPSFLHSAPSSILTSPTYLPGSPSSHSTTPTSLPTGPAHLPLESLQSQVECDLGGGCTYFKCFKAVFSIYFYFLYSFEVVLVVRFFKICPNKSYLMAVLNRGQMGVKIFFGKCLWIP